MLNITRRFLAGAAAGSRQAQCRNTAILDLFTGRFLYRNSSNSDAAAAAIDRLRIPQLSPNHSAQRPE